MSILTYYLYTNIPGAWHGWTLAVLAVNQADADRYIKIHNGGGKRAGMVSQGKVKADCGAVTSQAEEILRRNSK